MQHYPFWICCTWTLSAARVDHESSLHVADLRCQRHLYCGSVATARLIRCDEPIFLRIDFQTDIFVLIE